MSKHEAAEADRIGPQIERLPFSEGLPLALLRPEDFERLTAGELTPAMTQAIEMIRTSEIRRRRTHAHTTAK